MKLSFEYLRDEILRFKARSFLQQGSIVILRSIFNAAEGKKDDLTTQVKAPADATVPQTQFAIVELVNKFISERDLSKIEEIILGLFVEYIQQQQTGA